jgi:hypothetical protein
MAAAYLFHIVSNHPFVDGNTRAGLLSALVFLDVNGITISRLSDALYELTLGVAEGGSRSRLSPPSSSASPRANPRSWPSAAPPGVSHSDFGPAFQVHERARRPKSNRLDAPSHQRWCPQSPAVPALETTCISSIPLLRGSPSSPPTRETVRCAIDTAARARPSSPSTWRRCPGVTLRLHRAAPRLLTGAPPSTAVCSLAHSAGHAPVQRGVSALFGAPATDPFAGCWPCRPHFHARCLGERVCRAQARRAVDRRSGRLDARL